jgi:phospho-N-acetylmuramoyl-pentapeptide-transferase
MAAVMSLASAATVFLTSALGCLVLGRVAVPLLARARSVQPTRYADCPPLQRYQETKRGTPTMGGLFVLAVGVAVAGAAGGLAARDGWLVLGAVIGLAAIGLADDLLKFRRRNAGGLRTWPKLLVALAIGGAIGALISTDASSYAVLEIPWVRRTLDLSWGWVPFAMVVMAGCAHAVNLTDGMDGLAAGCVAIALAALGLWTLAGDPRGRVLLPWCAALAGACVGFLWFNSYPASVFLGDVGSLGLGGALGAISLLSHTSLWLLIIGGVFVLEAVSVMLQVGSYKWRQKRRVFRVAPLHHHFQLGGVPEPKVIARFWIAGLLLALLGLTTVDLR